MQLFSTKDFKLGILGGGQLGRMLLAETQKLDLNTFVLENSIDAPCAEITRNFIKGDWKNFDDVYLFGRDKNIITVEIEHINLDALDKLESEGVLIHPQPQVLRIIQNKGIQKDFYAKNNLPTALYKRYQSKQELLNDSILFPCIWKAETLGYDGNGVKKLNTIKDIYKLDDVPCIIEELIPFTKELSVIVARNKNGEIKTFPTVEMEFNPKNNQVEFVICPANISETINQKAQKIAIQTANAFKHIGLLAVELFLTKDDRIIINEVAPRPHNSGHYSIEASYTNQFEQHLRAILNLPLGCTKSKLPAVMYNLSGNSNAFGNVIYKNLNKILKLQGVTPHIYGKKIVKPNRKMGHVTVVHSSLREAKKIAKKVKQTIKIVGDKTI
ncbi:MAG: 5-(carboxyamino)imidazole ribonucleotide synthase [Bacteroidales bacterium]|nr:5-(carboxyamino)imidazole ribonucleotide synthase [Bacteroidales bacterium]